MTRPDTYLADIDPRDAALGNVLHEPRWGDVVIELLARLTASLVVILAASCVLVALAVTAVVFLPLALAQYAIGED